MTKSRYITTIDKRQNVLRYRQWNEYYLDEDTGQTIAIQRHRLIKINGNPVRFYSRSELKSMSKAEREKIKLPCK